MYLLSVAELIACKDANLFEAFLCSWILSATFYTLLYIERWDLGFRVLIPPLRRFEHCLTVCLVGRSHLNRRAQGQQHFPELGASRRFGQGATDVQRRLERKQAEVFGLRLQLQPNYLGLQIDEPAAHDFGIGGVNEQHLRLHPAIVHRKISYHTLAGTSSGGRAPSEWFLPHRARPIR